MREWRLRLQRSGCHELLDVVWFDWDLCHQVEVSVFTYEVVVFEAYADVFVGNVDARFDGEEHTCGNRLIWDADVMDIEAEVVRGAMHEVFPNERFPGWLFGGLLGCDETEVDEFQLGMGKHLFLIIREVDAGFENCFRLTQQAEDCQVDFELARGKFSRDGNGACHICVPASVFRGDVEE